MRVKLALVVGVLLGVTPFAFGQTTGGFIGETSTQSGVNVKAEAPMTQTSTEAQPLSGSRIIIQENSTAAPSDRTTTTASSTELSKPTNTSTSHTAVNPIPEIRTTMPVQDTSVSPKITPSGTLPPQNIESTWLANLRVQTEANAVSEKLTDSIEDDLMNQIRTIGEESTTTTGAKPLVFPKPTLKQKIQKRTDALSTQVTQVLTSSASKPDMVTNLDSAYKSSRKDIENIVLNETGEHISLSSASQHIAPEIVVYAQQFADHTAEARESGGLALYLDSDKDGVSDFDEEHIFNTDPHNPRTSGSPLTDGERVLHGLDVHATSNVVVPVESPIVAGPVVNDIFTVESIARIPQTENGTTTPAMVAFKGTAPPNSYITIYIYSNPIVVTVKTDSEGKWEYTLDTELANGSHEVHIAMVNNEGKILAKSAAIPFTRTAEAIEYTPALTPFSGSDPVSEARTNLVLLGVGAFVFLALFIIAMLGVARKNTESNLPPAPTP